MNFLTGAILRLPEYRLALQALAEGQSAALTGIGQINRSHILSGISASSGRPMVIICQDDMAAKRLQQELGCFLGITAPILPSRDWAWHPLPP